ncbi:hypothetical protein L226DRAFT_607076 [Lentinus tigrinus ALCF2SS1-7]|uniref:uncharacterized protein n=1 Tax=Lentinus tigrinus ALCF2SS1-7 TaxID=1328758 RepID=UPI001165CEA0|nr:hypothetical protein L226DRAFT_607076 [Lentinus tigrinus ALCF2SS1-7]
MHPPGDPPVLVDDLIPIIIESNDHWWPRDFQRLALISPAWVTPVRKRLYAHPSLRSFRACKLFARTLLDNPALLPYMRGLELRPVADSRRVLDEQEMQSLRYILGLEGIQDVTLGGDLALSAERFIHFMAGTRTITTLHIDGYSFPDDHASSTVHTLPSLEWDDVVAFRFPFLRSLTLSNVALAVYPQSMDHPGMLSHLTLNNVQLVYGALPDLCQGSWETLRVLKLVGKSTVELDDEVRSMLELCENLEELHYEAVDRSSHPSIFDDEPPTCESLQKLSISGFDVNPLTLEAIAHSCPKLTELAVCGRIIRIPSERWAAFVNSGALPCLQRLIAPAGTNIPPFMYWSSDQHDELRDACKSRGISLFSGAPCHVQQVLH